MVPRFSGGSTRAGASLFRGPGLLAGAVFLLFTIWSASFIAFEALLTPEAGAAQFDWLSLTAARFVPTALLCGLYCALFRREESVAILGAHWPRLLVCGLLVAPVYNLALYNGIQHRVPAPIASLLTCLIPLFVMGLSAAFLGESITRRRVLGFLLAVSGFALVATAKDAGEGVAYPLRIAITAIAPLSWAVHTVLTKPVSGRVSPLLWTYLALVIGTVPLVPVLPFAGLPELLALDVGGWAVMAYIVLLCTVFGFALWTWLLRHLPATSVGFTVFLNPPMTTGYKLLLATLLPATFSFTIVTGEAVGGLLMLAGVAVAVVRLKPP
ncbi:MAG: DMT family transporter [Planctomycetota bacterium]|jgi:drug/metabolite transporter (DMT)-like permease